MSHKNSVLDVGTKLIGRQSGGVRIISEIDTFGSQEGEVWQYYIVAPKEKFGTWYSENDVLKLFYIEMK